MAIIHWKIQDIADRNLRILDYMKRYIGFMGQEIQLSNASSPQIDLQFNVILIKISVDFYCGN